MFKTLDLRSLCERLCENKSTLIVFHARPDADAVGSAFALRELLRLMGILSFCVCVDEVPERLHFISEHAQDSVVFDENIPFGHERVISVDSASPAQLGSLFERLRKDIDIMIDHHASGTVYADSFIDAEAAATGEIIFKVAKTLKEMGKIEEIPPYVLDCCYAAISSDTGGLRFANTTPDTLRTVAELLEAGVDGADISHRLFSVKSYKQITAEAQGAKSLRTFAGGRVASVTLPFAVKSALELSEEHLETLIEIPRSLEGAEVAFSVRQPSAQRLFRVSMRSSTDFDVAEICKKFGGGGHVRAAGCSLEASDIDEAENIIAAEIISKLR